MLLLMMMLQVSPGGHLNIMLIERPAKRKCALTQNHAMFRGRVGVEIIISLPFLLTSPSTFGSSALDPLDLPPKGFAPIISDLDPHLPELHKDEAQ